MDVLILLISLLTIINGVHGARNVTINLLDSAVAKGAVCLDGTPPAYAYREGYGDGADRWIVYLQGGGWCESNFDCFQRSQSYMGSSSNLLMVYNNQIQFNGMLDENATFNPDFYNWNIFYIFYCDGSSYMSDIKEVDPVYNITYRGARIFDAMIEELFMNKGMTNATDVILSGGSAGGLATILHCDKFGALFPTNTTRVKCVADSGFFIHGARFLGTDVRVQRFINVISTHGLANSLPTSCTEKLSPILCFFPENLLQDIQTPLFLIESAFDKAQIHRNIYPDDAVNHDPEWNKCTNDDLNFCNWTHIKTIKDFGSMFKESLRSSVDKSSRIGYYVHSCYRHCHLLDKDAWTCSFLVGSNTLAKKSIGQAVSDWYFDKSLFQEIDMRNDFPGMCYNYFTTLEFEKICSDELLRSN